MTNIGFVKGVALRAVFVGMAGFLMAPTCGNEITVKSVDTSPPDVYFAVDRGDGPRQTSGTIWVDPGETMDVYGIVTDNQSGAKQIEMSGGFSRYCRYGDLASITAPLSSVTTENQTTTPGQKAFAGLNLKFDYRAPNPICEGNPDEAAQTNSYYLTGKNGKNTQRSATLTVRVRPPAPPSPAPPPPPPTCTGNTRCCEPAPGGGCYLCINSSMQCP